MPSSYVSNHVHIVFSTKNRLKVIPEDLQTELWAYMAGIAKKHSMHAVAIGGIEDHAHALIDMGPTLGIAKTVQVWKANSSRWKSDHPGVRFGWQVGSFACSVSRSKVPTVRQYIASQKEHHQKIDSATEFRVVVEEAWI
jgi:REP element-mobilizing transposase RayT